MAASSLAAIRLASEVSRFHGFRTGFTGSRVHRFTGSRVQGSFTRPVATLGSSAALFVAMAQPSVLPWSHVSVLETIDNRMEVGREGGAVSTRKFRKRAFAKKLRPQTVTIDRCRQIAFR